MMLAVTACYTTCTLNDKYAVSRAGFAGGEFTFLVSASLSVFLMFSLPFQEIRFTIAWQSFVAVGLIALDKILEFYTCAIVLKELSAFELKAWLGLTLFMSYFTDVIFGEDVSILRIGFITVTAFGLVLIAHSKKEHPVRYRAILLPLIFYLISKYAYGLVIRGFTPYASPIMQLIPAMVIVTLVTAFTVNLRAMFRKSPRAAGSVIIARIPNTVGIILENAVIAISLTNYSFIQPMVLVTLFFISLIQREKRTTVNLIGSILCMIGVIGFQAFR